MYKHEFTNTSRHVDTCMLDAKHTVYLVLTFSVHTQTQTHTKTETQGGPA